MVSDAPAAVGAPVPPHRGLRQQRRIVEGKQRRVFQGHDAHQGEDSTAATTTAADSQDSCSSSYHLYHRLVTYPLEEIRLPAAQVGGAAGASDSVLDGDRPHRQQHVLCHSSMVWCAPYIKSRQVDGAAPTLVSMGRERTTCDFVRCMFPPHVVARNLHRIRETIPSLHQHTVRTAVVACVQAGREAKLHQEVDSWPQFSTRSRWHNMVVRTRHR